MKQILLICAAVALVGCGGKKEPKQEPELRSEKVITPDEAANELFVEAVELVDEAESREATNVAAAIEKYEQALEKLQTISSEYKKSDLAVKLVSGETLFTGKSLRQIRERVVELKQSVFDAERIAAEGGAVKFQSAVVEEAVRVRLKKPKGELTKADLEKVTNLNLSFTQITDAGLKDVAKLQNLTDLYLSGTQITDAGLKDMAKLQKLEGLHLSGTQITDAGLKDVAKMQNLTNLNLSFTQITDAGLKDVAKLQNLTDLNLMNSTQITDAGLKDVAKLQNLTDLYLSVTKITDAGLKDVAKMQNLTNLHLSFTKITDAGLKDVAKMQNLTNLHLSGTKITDENAAELKKTLPKCEITHSYKKD